MEMKNYALVLALSTLLVIAVEPNYTLPPITYMTVEM